MLCQVFFVIRIVGGVLNIGGPMKYLRAFSFGNIISAIIVEVVASIAISLILEKWRNTEKASN